ncbi:carbohydrate-binding family 9-like protein [Haloarcula amylovorans]|uniref:carbohydrate-binding family 9-like protein n=1 Tax=Haloarcula amylovorans TaxID=2562280 RepID=UPI001076471F|nr:carbohydrate-binding family 9-like protein [Halomicroarcula amylolytica]
MRTYDVQLTDGSVSLTHEINVATWETASVTHIDSFTWGEEATGPETTVRALHTDKAFFLQFHAEDSEISATVTELNGPTFRDSSVEFFANPIPDDEEMYFNFEVNCCGTFKLGWQEYGWQEKEIGRDEISPQLADEIDIATSIPGQTRQPKPNDESWWVAVRLPVSTLESFTGRTISIDQGSTWRGNFYRSGIPDPQKATWNPLDTPKPEYHTPEQFGRLKFR